MLMGVGACVLVRCAALRLRLRAASALPTCPRAGMTWLRIGLSSCASPWPAGARPAAPALPLRTRTPCSCMCMHVHVAARSSDLHLDARRDLRDLGCHINVINNVQALDRESRALGMAKDYQEGVLFM